MTSVAIPATVESIDVAFFQLFPNAKSVSVADDNPKYQSHNGMLFDEELTSLLLVPEGMEGVAVLPDSLAAVPAYVFSRCIKLSAIQGSTGNDSFSFADGIVYSKNRNAEGECDGTLTLVAAPAGLGNSAKIASECTAIAEGAFAGNIWLRTIVAGGQVSDIAKGAFEQSVVEVATVAIAAAEGYDEARKVWESAGFTNFTDPAEPGQTIEPTEGSGFAFTLLDDYTLAVRWQGEEAAPANLQIPLYGTIDGVRYKVSAIADEGFKGQPDVQRIEIPDSVTTIGTSAFEEATSLHTVNIPGNVTTIGNSAFKGCESLIALDMNEGLVTIGDSAFEGIPQISQILPKSVKSVGDYAFANSPNLETIVALGTINMVGTNALAGVTNCKVYVPYNEQEAYPWKMGPAASANHMYPYGVKLPSEPIQVKVGQTASLFDNGGYLYAPEGFEVEYSYKAKPISVNGDGVIEGKDIGLTNVELSLLFKLNRVVVAAPISKQAYLEKATNKENEHSIEILNLNPSSDSTAIQTFSGSIDPQANIGVTVKVSSYLFSSGGGAVYYQEWYRDSPGVNEVPITGRNVLSGSNTVEIQAKSSMDPNYYDGDTWIDVFMDDYYVNGKYREHYTRFFSHENYPINSWDYEVVPKTGFSFMGAFTPVLSGITVSANGGNVAWQEWYRDAPGVNEVKMDQGSIEGTNTKHIAPIVEVYNGNSFIDLFTTPVVINGSTKQHLYRFYPGNGYGIDGWKLNGQTPSISSKVGVLIPEISGMTVSANGGNVAWQEWYRDAPGVNEVKMDQGSIQGTNTKQITPIVEVYDGGSFVDLFTTPVVINGSTKQHLYRFYPGNGYGISNWKLNGQALSISSKVGLLAPTLVANTYTVRYWNNSGTTEYTNLAQSCKYDTAFALKAAPTTGISTGYSAASWSTSRNRKSADNNYAFNKSGMKNLTSTNKGTVNLYLAETANTYTVRYWNNSGTTEYTNLAQSCKYDTAFALKAAPTTGISTGYSAASWSTSRNRKSADNNYAFNKSGMKNLTSTNKGTVNLYLAETVNNYNVSFTAAQGSSSPISKAFGTVITAVLNGGSSIGWTNNQASVPVGGLNVPNTGKTGYVFNGWSLSGNTLTAQFTPIASEVSFSLNGGTGYIPPTISSLLYDASMPEFNIPAPIRIGYTFMGWYDNPDYEEGTQYYSIDGTGTHAWNKASDTTLYAGWKANVYNVTYVPLANNGDTTAEFRGTSQNVQFTYGMPKDIPDIASENYTFLGWYAMDDPEGVEGTIYTPGTQQIVDMRTDEGSFVTLLPKWAEKNSDFIVSFDANVPDDEDYSGTMEGIQCQSGLRTDLPRNTYVRPGYTFMGWSISPDTKVGTGTTGQLDGFYTDEQKQVMLTANKDDDGKLSLTLYAVWSPQISWAAPMVSPLNLRVDPTQLKSEDIENLTSPDVTKLGKLVESHKSTIDTADYENTSELHGFQSMTPEKLYISSIDCDPITGDAGTVSVFPDENTWNHVIIRLAESSGSFEQAVELGGSRPGWGLQMPYVPGSCFVIPARTSVAKTDDNGNPVQDDEGNPVFKLAPGVLDVKVGLETLSDVVVAINGVNNNRGVAKLTFTVGVAYDN